MVRCSHCQYDNQDDALACARCGHTLTRAAVAPAGTDPKLPDWLSAMESGQPQAGPEPDSDAGQDQARKAEVIGSVAAAAAMPVQVRRSRVPLVVADRPLTAAGESLPEPATSPAVTPTTVTTELKPARRRNNSRLIILVLVLVILIAILAYFALGHVNT